MLLEETKYMLRISIIFMVKRRLYLKRYNKNIHQEKNYIQLNFLIDILILKTSVGNQNNVLYKLYEIILLNKHVKRFSYRVIKTFF